MQEKGDGFQYFRLTTMSGALIADAPQFTPPPIARTNNEQRTVVANAPGNGALLRRCRRLVGLALDAEIHNVVPANRAVVDHNVPRPQCHRVPLLHHKAWSGNT